MKDVYIKSTLAGLSINYEEVLPCKTGPTTKSSVSFIYKITGVPESLSTNDLIINHLSKSFLYPGKYEFKFEYLNGSLVDYKKELEKDRIKIGKKIAYIRKEKGLNQGELAVITGMTQQSISRYESGSINIGFEALKKIANALDCKIGDITE
ncbi:MAG: helix-turn-helix transcriptional regulator [Bacteroidales bacterium]|nr:helix-turn-helix transcriptional regulator [Bacteroidales bacterium]